MKKSLLMTLSALMLGTLMLTGCGTEKTETTAQTSAETTTQTETDSAEKMVREREGLLSNCLVLKKKSTVKKWI